MEFEFNNIDKQKRIINKSVLKRFIAKIPQHQKGLVFISTTALIWSSGGLFIKLLPLNAYKILFYRSGFAVITVILLGTLLKKGMKFEFELKSNLSSIFYAGILICFVLATKMTTAANAIFLQFTAPIYLLVLEPIFIKTKFDKKSLATIIVCIFGMVLFFFGRLELGDIYGNLIAILSGICFACFALLLKWKKLLGQSENNLVIVVLGNVLVSVVTFFIIFPNLALTISELVILLYMGIIQIGVSYIIFNEGLKYVSATESMIIATLEAVFNPIWVFLGVGEQPSGFAILGGIIIIGAIIWRNVGTKEISS
jgi:drug/metabolite transporter, DME family